MPKKRYKNYKVRLHVTVKTRREAEALAEELKQQYGGHTEVAGRALDRCPGKKDNPSSTMDHAHASYDGATICDLCEGELGDPRHTQGWARR